jgi:polyphosphate kinase 2 (PPK2 family)
MRSQELTTAPVQAASKHWDYIVVSRIYNQRSGKSESGYLAGDQWDVKPGEMREYNDLMKSAPVPACEKLLTDGVVRSYGMDTEDFHQQKLGRVTFYFTTSDASGLDKASKAFDEAFDKNAALGAAFRSMTDREGHRDFLARLRYMTTK